MTENHHRLATEDGGAAYSGGGSGGGGGGAGGQVVPPQKGVRGQTYLFATPHLRHGRVKKLNNFMTKYITRHINIRIYNR